MTCRFASEACTCAGLIENCPLVVRAFGPPRKMCRRCDAEALPHSTFCAECRVKYQRTPLETLHDRRAAMPETLARAAKRRRHAECLERHATPAREAQRKQAYKKRRYQKRKATR